MFKEKKIDLYVDGLKPEEFDKKFKLSIEGYTFNPSIFKKNGASDYMGYCKKILSKIDNKPVSFEVFADDETNMLLQALILSKLSSNVYVKIPIIFTNGESTVDVIKKLNQSNVKMNITAIFTLDQIKKILPSIKDTKNILSIFAGRIFDSGINAYETMQKINHFVKQNSNCRTLWASPRMSFDYISAIETGTDIITMQPEQIIKLEKFGKNLEEYSKETVKQFYDDAKSSGYEIK